MKILDIPRSGSYQGITSSHNRAGQYVRNRRTPTNTPTMRRSLIRSAFASASSAWGALTAGQQGAWIAAADAHPVTDRLGSSIKLTGHQLFISIATQLQNCDLPLPTDPPLDFSVYSLSPGTLGASLASGITVTLPGNGSPADFALLALSRPVPAGRTVWGTFTQQQVDSGDSVSIIASTASYGALFGTPAVGQKLFAKVTPVNEYGVTGVPIVLSAIWTA